MKVTMTEAICQEGMALLDGKAEIFVAHDAHPHNYLDQLKDTDAFIVRVADKGAIDRKTMESSPALKVIGRTGIGYDSVDVESATELGIPV
ncbi:MAG: phosphoglycerate dehydrogenase, partial [Dysosmobacter sp.]|nr:phosphoglycerate dehydrogenase [Dysosmobacter sp.]